MGELCMCTILTGIYCTIIISNIRVLCLGMICVLVSLISIG